MKISPINVNYNRSSVQRRVSQTPITQPTSATISFKAQSTYEKEVEERTKEIIKEKNMSSWEQFWGGEAEAREQAIKEIDQRNLNLKLDNVRKEAIIGEQRKFQEQQENYIKSIKDQQEQTNKLVESLQKSTEQTISVQQEALEAQKKASETIKEQLNNYQKLMQEQQELQAQKETKTREFMEKMNQANAEQNKQMAEMYKQQMEQMQKIYESKIVAKGEQAQEASKIANLYQKLHEVNDNKGFGRIAGYQNEKDYLVDLVGNSIITEQSGNPTEVVNGILFYGPKGSGKTTFAKAFAEQLGCRLVKVNNYINPDKNMNKLYELVEKAKENFEKDNVRTILYLDEINGFAPKDSPIIEPLKSLLDDLSTEYHCTLFATTNFPEKLDDIMLRDGRFGVKVGLAPADEKNAEEVLRHYGKAYADESVNFAALAAEIIKEQPNKAYSNARIKSVVENFVRTTKITKMTQQDFLQSIKETAADITKEALELFERQRSYVKHI